MHETPGRKDLLDEAELLDPPGGATLRLRFSGQFEGQSVTWLATLRALANPEPEQKQEQEQGETPLRRPEATSKSVRTRPTGFPSPWGSPLPRSTSRRSARPSSWSGATGACVGAGMTMARRSRASLGRAREPQPRGLTGLQPQKSDLPEFEGDAVDAV